MDRKGKTNFEERPEFSGSALVDTADARLSNSRNAIAHTASHKHGGSDEVATATPAANAVVKANASGELADGWVPSSNVTQHVGSIDHNSLQNYAVAQHRVINDSGASTTELWSASKVSNEIAANGANRDLKDSVETVATSDITLSGEQTLNSVLTSGSRVGVVAQSTASENGIYVSAAGAWSRAADADADAEVTQGLAFYVADGDKKGSAYIITTPDPITVDTTDITFTEIPLIVLGTSAGTAAEGNDSRIPSQDENNALVGTDGTPSTSNKFVTNSDSRMTNARTPSSHASSHQNGGGDEVATATPAANAVPKAGGDGKLADGWIPDAIARDSELHSHSNKAQLDLLTDGDHDARTDNPHVVTKAQVGLSSVENLKANLVASVAPTANEDSGDGYAVGSVWIDTTADKAYICADATVAAAVWKETTVAAGGGGVPFSLDFSWSLHSAVGGDPALSAKTASYETLVPFIFGGTTRYGSSPTKIYLLAWCDSGMTFDLKVQDVTNAQTIGEVTGLSNTAAAIVDLGTLSNLPAGQAIFELQFKGSVSNKVGYVSALSVQWS